MNVRAPWLAKRATLGSLALLDAASFIFLYTVAYMLVIGEVPTSRTGLLVNILTWVTTSYLVGRYSPATKSSSNRMKKGITKSLTAASSVLAVVLLHSWIFGVAGAETRSVEFLGRVLVGQVVVSTTAHLALMKYRRKTELWMIFVSEAEMSIIAGELKCERSELRDSCSLLRYRGLKDVNLKRAKNFTIVIGGKQGQVKGVKERVIEIREAGIPVISLTQWCESELQRIPPELVSEDWLIDSGDQATRPGSIGWRIKRMADIIASTALIAVTSPIVAICCLAIVIEDGMPILYKQKRSGLYSCEIEVVKLRSMRINAEEGGPQWSRKGDPRITRVGAILRRLRLDELPQLLSVLKGNMSLIGPRPERPEFEKELETEIDNYRLKHWLKPGLSGWAQVCYPYGASIADSRAKLSYDLYYLKNGGLLLDMLIALKTIRLVINARGAVAS